jgi:hypothetical protein
MFFITVEAHASTEMAILTAILPYNPTQPNPTQHNTTQHNTTQHNTTQHNPTQHNTTQHNTTQHNIVLCWVDGAVFLCLLRYTAKAPYYNVLFIYIYVYSSKFFIRFIHLSVKLE